MTTNGLPVIDGKQTYITNAGDGNEQEWVITSRPFGEGGDFLRIDGKWVRDIGVDDGPLFEWPTEASAITFLTSLAEQAKPSAAVGEFYILDVEESQRSDECLWWRPKNSGYTCCLETAGRYSLDEVRARQSYYDNGEQTIAVPCEAVDKHAVRVVPATMQTLNEFSAARLNFRGPLVPQIGGGK